MKQFFIWAGIVSALFAGLTATSQLVTAASGQKILVAIDVSVSLADYRAKLPEALAFLNTTRFGRFKIVTNSPNRDLQVVQDWSDKLNLTAVMGINMYTPLPLSDLLDFPDIADADQIVFVTNAIDTRELAGVARSQIIRVR